MACKCNVGIQDLGYPNCVTLMGVAKYLIFTEVGDGVQILPNPTPDAYATDFGAGQNYWAIGEAKMSTKVSNFKWTKADPTTETLDDGVPLFVVDGRVSLEWSFVRAPAGLLRYLENLRCFRGLVFYIVDIEGRLWGIEDITNNMLRPIPVLPESFVFKLEPNTYTTTQKINVKVTLDYFEESKLRGIGSSITAWDGVVQLIASEVFITEALAGNSEIKADLLALYGDGSNTYQHITGLTSPSDWYITINGIPVTPTSISEVPGSPYVQPDGNQYRFALSSPLNSGDAVMVRFNGGVKYGMSSATALVP